MASSAGLVDFHYQLRQCGRLMAGPKVHCAQVVGPAVLPVNYRWHDGAVVFRTTRHSALDEDLQTGISRADFLVAFEIDEIDTPGRQGGSVLIQGPAHHVESEEARARAEQADVEPWPAGERELFLRIIPNRVTGRRIKPA
jgi:nitroimidazol reductase NimA-like FMN-containing flavoprotein (pyridoxamine 5'-phosphate oxidase superfamily)